LFADISQNEAAKAIGMAAMAGLRLPIPQFFRDIWPLLEQRSMESVEKFVSNQIDDAMDCSPDQSNEGWWVNTRAASDLPRSVSILEFLLSGPTNEMQYADNIRARKILVERLRHIRDATETVADNTRGQITKYGEEMLEVVQVIEAFRTAVHKKPSRDHADSPPAPSECHRQGGDATQLASQAQAGQSGTNRISPPRMPIPSTSALPLDVIDLTD
jgi:hypothetical protein